MSLPICTPAKLRRFSVAQEMSPGTGAPANDTPVVVAVLRVVTSPPMPRTHTPPPSWSGPGLAGAPTNAVDWVRKAVFEALIADTSEETAPPAANGRN